MKIDVTQEDIDQGLRNDGWKCPVGRGVQRATNDGDFAVEIDRIVRGTEGDEDYLSVELPEDVGERICKFDDGLGMQPFSFEIDLPPNQGEPNP